MECHGPVERGESPDRGAMQYMHEENKKEW